VLRQISFLQTFESYLNKAFNASTNLVPVIQYLHRHMTRYSSTMYYYYTVFQKNAHLFIKHLLHQHSAQHHCNMQQ